MSLFGLVLTQTVSHAFRKGGGAFGTCAFYVIAVTLFTFAIGPDGIRQYAPAVMCVALLFAAVTSLPLLFERDYEDGSLEQYLLLPVALEVIVLAKITGQWLAVIMPIILLSPALALIADLPPDQIANAVLRLLLASPTVIAIGALAAALTIGNRRGGLLQALIMLPLATPVLIFAATGGQGAMLFLGGLLLASVPLACLVCAALVRAAD